MSKYKLKSGQINFENQDYTGSYACVVIKNGEFFNMTEDLRLQLISALQKEGEPKKKEEPSLEDMF